MNQTLLNILHFLHDAEGLKRELRHSWLSDSRQESVAEHTWRTALMALVLFKEVDPTLQISRVLQMVIIHDLGEIFAGDVPVYGSTVPVNKHALEEKALQKLLHTLPGYTAREILGLWHEFEQAETKEAKFSVALDKLEVLIQHNEADTSTYLAGEGKFNLTYANNAVLYSRTLRDLRKLVRQETEKKINR